MARGVIYFPHQIHQPIGPHRPEKKFVAGAPLGGATNYYTGGFANAQRLTRGLGMAGLLLVFLFG